MTRPGRSKIGLARALRELPGLPDAPPVEPAVMRIAEFCDYLGRLLEDHGGRVRWQGLDTKTPSSGLDVIAPDGTALRIEVQYG